MTDGGIYLGDVAGQRFEAKRYEIQDGLGIHFMLKAGIRVAIVTGRVSDSVTHRAKELGVEDVSQDPNAQKLPGFLAILQKHGISPSEAAFVGDDLPDMPIMRIVGLPVAVGNAVAEIRAVTKLHLRANGGHGAIREFSELLLKARGEWQSVTDAYVAERSGSKA